MMTTLLAAPAAKLAGIGLAVGALALLAGSMGHALYNAGAAEAHIDQLEQIQAHNAQEQARLTRALQLTHQAVQAAEVKAQAAGVTAETRRVAVTTLPVQGADSVCPIDCTVPEELFP